MPEFFFFLTGLALGGLAAWQVARARLGGDARLLEKTTADLARERETTLDQARQIAALEADYRNLEDKLFSQKKELETLQARFAHEFRALAADILEDKSRRFTEQNRSQLDQLLRPLAEKIQAFEKRVEQTYDADLRDKISLREEIRQLHQTSAKLGQDADNLARALRGDTKRQGNWGELILEKILERSGLTAGVEYRTQVTTRNAQTDVIRPDVVVFLPDEKHLVVDAKVSLVAYESWVACEDEADRDRCLREHLLSVRNHVRQLGDKSYFSGEEFASPEFTLLFMPIESAFSLALQRDAELFQFAWERRIVLVSPTTLLATLRTVASVWKMEKQSRHALEIARLSGELYDKLAGVLEDFTKIGRQLDAARTDYGDAMKRLYEGKGNVVRTAEKIRDLGARHTKNLPNAWLSRAEE
jgi:DNA recombination protein RmuC